ncbi:MAG: T9SS type A sorting domain-containing protein [Bacteroidetes bacterium]|nr:T9SS type A sorting domain-containing protein [Bacteroidota bacterium]
MEIRLLCILLFLNSFILRAQEHVAPLDFNGSIRNAKQPVSTSKTTAQLTLPYFEDFAQLSGFPDNTKWADYNVYINNTMCVSPVSRGVATFDGLDSHGLPYNQSVSTALVYADSLTSLTFDLSTNQPSDSIYFSFFYQPQGNGFSPEAPDSLMLFFRKSNNAWTKVWAKEGSTLDSFKQVMIPIRDTVFMHTTFQFCFVNKASLNTNDDVWNVDYIRIAAGRSMTDTAVNDMAFTTDPSYLLNDYTYMPYRQFMADVSKERATQLLTTIHNNYTSQQTATYGFTAYEKSLGTPLFTSSTSSLNIAADTIAQVSLPMYSNTIPSTKLYDYFTFVTKFFVQSLSASDPKVNDTIVREQIFHNYLAYDDGTAEKAYYLNLFPTLPGKTAIDFHLNQPDTILGVSIYFGRQVPLAYGKYFSVAVYKDISMTGGSDQLIYQEDFLVPAYDRNDFYWTYKFTKPVPMSAGTFYMGTIQPALSNSDSLYIGLDVNRQTSNHLYYNVVGYWQPSAIQGALMIRPVLGEIIASGVNDVKQKDTPWSVSPNPCNDFVQINIEGRKDADYEIYDVAGRMVLTGRAADNIIINISGIAPGVYYIKLRLDGVMTSPKKITKY